MTDEIKLLPCPFCGREAKMLQPVEGLGMQWNAYCTGADDPDSQPDCGIVQFGLCGQSQSEVAALWNRRWVNPAIRDFLEKFRDYQPDNKKSNRALRIAYSKVHHFLTP